MAMSRQNQFVAVSYTSPNEVYIFVLIIGIFTFIDISCILCMCTLCVYTSVCGRELSEKALEKLPGDLL